jgi:tRNA 2-thiouridine synthesizing protein A
VTSEPRPHPAEPESAQPAKPEPNQPTPIVVDATGLRCPLPIIRLAAAARTAPAGTVITLLSTDPAAEPDVAAWCRMRHQDLLDQRWSSPEPAPEAPRTLTSRIRVTPPPPGDR